ncbi:SulP family inorganic anion transporter [Cytobacillus oceanisediminis]|uniref:SulP family inorganic anion transporter n=1 Tax=Cytobacillus oceanisediminis TaxID=665099 RepID=UPI0023DA1609|nr:SulP family inorganic anion transporter [Cytobacillus oceanisediminis]MDF2036425.1 SulP family inorganic anion transporter [Cytobacillus oceanisediminis]
MQRKWFFIGRYSGYSLQSFQKDLLSGLVVGVIAIPLGMAFAIASGVNPEYGIYTTIIAGILISLFGGSKFQIGGPTGAFIPILFGIVMTYGYENLLIAGFIAGVILCFMGIFRIGSLIKFIPRPVTIGFTSGIAVIIFIGQLANFLGLTGVEKHESFLRNIREIILHFHTINVYSVLTAGLCLITVILTPKFMSKVPGSLIGLLVSTLAAMFLYPNQVATIGSTFGDIPSSIPRFGFPEITFEKIQLLIGPAFIIALLGGIESLLSAVVADGMTKSKHHSNRELLGQGIANMITPLFGGIPATGAIARTATNIKNGAISPLSGMIHGIVVLLILVLFAPYASNIPLASMAPILMVVAWNMSERKEFYHVLKTKTEDSLVLVVTFLLTIFVNLTIAVEVGLILAIVLFTKRMSDMLVTSKSLPNPKNKHEKIQTHMVTDTHDCPQISIYNVEGPLFFGAAQAFEQSIMNTINNNPRVILLRMGKVPFVDTTGEFYVSGIVKDLSKHGVILISGLKPQPKSVLKKTGIYDFIGEEHFFEHTGDAINFALKHLNKEQCFGCKHFAFRECAVLSCQKSDIGQIRKVADSS